MCETTKEDIERNKFIIVDKMIVIGDWSCYLDEWLKSNMSGYGNKSRRKEKEKNTEEKIG